MMTTKNKVLIFSLIFIVGSYISTLFYYNQQIKKNVKQQNLLLDSLERITNNSFDLERNTEIGFQNENISLHQEIVLKDENGKSISLKNIVNKQAKLVFRFSEFSCSTCLKQLNELINHKADDFKNNIVFISNYSDKEKLEFFRVYLNIHYKIYTSDNLYLPIDNEGIPYFFILDNDMISKMFFIPIPNNNKLSNKYLEKAELYLKSKETTNSYNIKKQNI